MKRTGGRRFAFLCFVFAVAPFILAARNDSPFLGSWDLTIATQKGDVASWIEVTGDQEHPAIRMVGESGHATSLQKAEIHANEITFVASKEDQGFGQDVTFRGKVSGPKLEGSATGSDGKIWHWRATKAPALERKQTPAWGKPIQLFDGKDLAGWKLRTEGKPGGWRVANGTLIIDGPGSDLVSTSSFEDFKLHLEFKSGPSSNSGVYLRGRYEVQIETDSIAEPKSHHTGGVYGFLEPDPEQPRKPDEWQSFDISLVGRELTVVQNGVTILARQKIPGITGGALDSHEGLPGPICLQGSEPGSVAFRNIVVTPAVH